MIRIVRSQRLETLADALCDALAPKRPTLDLTPDLVIVPSMAVTRWLEWRFAQRFGIAANLDCPYPAQFLWRTIGQVLPGVPERSPFDPDALTWRLYRLLGAVQHDPAPDFAPVRTYLERVDGLGRMQLAERIAAVFDRYLAYRGDAWLATWARNETVGLAPAETEAWQARLWRMVLDDLGLRHDEHPFTRLLAVLARGGDAAGVGLPACIRLFGVPTLAPLYWQAFEALARYVPVECYVLAPSREFIADLVTEKQRARVALAAPDAAALYDVGHALVAADGRQAIDQQLALLRLEEAGASCDDRFDLPAPPATLLGALQSSIVTLEEQPALPAPDGSVQIHACHSLIRQLEVLHDELLRRFAADPDLRPADVIVCVPDLAAAAPAIDAVFGAVPEARRIPYRMTGRAEAQAAPLVAALLAVLDLARGRGVVDAALAVLRVPACARRFELDAAGLACAADWLAQGGARWGWDAPHRAELGLPAEPRHTWADALERIVIGYVMPDGARVDDVVGVEGVEGSRAEVAAALLEFVAGLRALAQATRGPRPAVAWAAVFARAFEDFFEPDDDVQAEATRIRAALAALSELATRAACDEPVDFALVRDRFERLLEARAPGGAPTGAVTFAGLGPLRGIPARVVALLGLDDGVFPRRAETIEFDLMATQPRPGDRNRRDDDRALFLDALMAARDVFFIGYRGRDAREGGLCPPAPVVGELIDFITRAAGDAVATALVHEHPLQAFSPRAFEQAPASYASELVAAAEAVRRPVAERPRGRLVCDRPLPEPEPEARTVRLEHLVGLLAHPARFFLRDRLRLRLELHGAALEEDEPFVLDGSAAWALRARLTEALRAGVADDAHLRTLADADPSLPHGLPGERAFEQVLREVRTDVGMVGAIERAVGALEVLPVRLECGPFCIEGSLAGVHARGVLGWRTGKVSMHARAEAYVSALLASILAGEPRPAYWHCRDGAVLATPADARAELQHLLDLYWNALRSPLLCPSRTAWGLLAALGKSDPAAARRDSERKHWRAPENDHGRGESEDLWWRVLIGDHPDRVPDLADFPGATNVFGGHDFSALARFVYGPMAAAVHEDAATLKDYRATLGVDA